LIIAVLLSGCAAKHQINLRLDTEMPHKILWVWERPEELRFLDPNEFGVAFLAQTIFLEMDRATPRQRRQPLEVSPGTYMIAVTRIETQKEMGKRPAFDSDMVDKVAALIATTTDLPDVKAVQVDFDAGSSERPFYRQLMFKLRERLDKEPDKSPRIPLTMTSLASWCTGDAWFNDFPVDEAVPMVFQMGADEEKIKTYLRNGNDWREPLCRGSYGLSIDGGRFAGVRPTRRLYFFKNDPWTPSDVTELR
jgi:hypothetical protein